MTRRLLGLYAHPDDEILSPGGTVSDLARQGVQIEWVCTTRGEAGEISDPELATRETLGQVREREMLCAAEMLGIQHVTFLGYRDSGMAGTEDNQHPQAYMNAPAEEVVPRLVQIMRRFRPHVALTFEPFGGYGHPDHIAIHKHSLAALEAAADPGYRPDLGPSWQIGRLYYPILRVSIFDRLRERMVDLGLDVEFMDRIREHRLKAWPDEVVHYEHDISNTFDLKWAAFECHRTQFGPDNLFRRLPIAEMKSLLRYEHFAQAIPEPAPGTRLQDLFEGLNLAE